MKLVIDIMGWSGSTMIVTGYLLISFHKVHAGMILYQLLNIIGSALLLVNTAFYRTIPASALNVVWLAVGLVAIIRIKFGKISKH